MEEDLDAAAVEDDGAVAQRTDGDCFLRKRILDDCPLIGCVVPVSSHKGGIRKAGMP